MKKMLALVLALLMTVGMATVAFAAEDKIIAATSALDKNATISTDSVAPGTKMEFPLTADMFSWSSNIPPRLNAPVTRAQIIRANVKPTISGSSSVVKNATIEYKALPLTGGQTTAVVVLEFINPFVSTTSRDFDFNLFLQIGTRQPDSRVRLQGTFENKQIIVDGTDDYVDLSGGGKVIKATATVRNLEIDLDNGVSIRTNVFNGQKYFAYCTDELTEDDDQVLTKYPSITDIVRLQTINLKKNGKYIDLSAMTGYAYNASGKSLGKTTALVEYSDTYYISTTDLGSSISVNGSGGGSSTQIPPHRLIQASLTITVAAVIRPRHRVPLVRFRSLRQSLQ